MSSNVKSLSEYAAPCPACDRRRYIIEPVRDFAQASVCSTCFQVCPSCQGAEFVDVVDQNGYRYVRPCATCSTLRNRIEAFNRAQVPARYHSDNSTLEAFETSRNGKALGNLPEIKLRLYRWVKAFVPADRGFLLYGNVGTGKTHLLAALTRHLTLEKGVNVRFIEFSHLVSELKEGFDRNVGESSILGPLSEVDVLAIDELGKGRTTDWQLSVLDQIISKRYNRELTTLFTTNFAVGSADKVRGKALFETLEERVGPRVYSRLFEMADFIGIDAPDFRRRDQP